MGSPDERLSLVTRILISPDFCWARPCRTKSLRKSAPTYAGFFGSVALASAPLSMPSAFLPWLESEDTRAGASVGPGVAQPFGDRAGQARRSPGAKDAKEPLTNSVSRPEARTSPARPAPWRPLARRSGRDVPPASRRAALWRRPGHRHLKETPAGVLVPKVTFCRCSSWTSCCRAAGLRPAW